MKSNYNVLLLGSSANAGLTFYYSRLAIVFKKLGIEVIVLYDGREQYEKLTKELEEYHIKRYVDVNLHNINVFNLVEEYRLFKEIGEKEKDIDFILGGCARESLKIYFLKKIMKVPALSVIGSFPETFPLYKLYSIFAFNKIYDINIVLSNYSKVRMINLGVKKNKLFVDPIFSPDLEWFDQMRVKNVNLEKYCLDDISHPVVFYSARHERGKGLEHYLTAASYVLKKYDATFVVGGEGTLTPFLKKLAEKLEISKHIIFTGWIKIFDMPYVLYNIADICVNPSIEETLSSYLLECMAAAKPVISSGVGIAPEIIENGKNGFVIPQVNPNMLSRYIMFLLENMEMAKTIGKNARKVIEQKVNMRNAAQRLLELFNWIKD